MAHYVKLFESIIHSTLWCNEPPATRVVWVTLLAMSDSDGEVQASIPGLAKAAGVSLEECETALLCFMSPDPYSRSKEAEGRRIQEIRGGWELINYKHYRHLKSVEQEKENAAGRQQRKRDRDRTVTVVTESHRESPHIEEEEDVKEEEQKQIIAPPPASLAGDVVEIWNESIKGSNLPKARLTPPRAKVIQLRLKDASWLGDFRAACAFLVSSPFHRGCNERGWMANLDFVLQAGKATELAEKRSAGPPAINGNKSPAHRSRVDSEYLEGLKSKKESQPRKEDVDARANAEKVFQLLDGL